jgi:two-component sensor histidine kinase
LATRERQINAFKYAYPDRVGEVRVHLKRGAQGAAAFTFTHSAPSSLIQTSKVIFAADQTPDHRV